MNEEDLIVVEAMQTMGGGFIRALAMAAVHADPQNLAKIKKTWPDYWEDYKKMAANKKKQKQK